MDDSGIETALISSIKGLTGIPFVSGNVPSPAGASLWARVTYGPGEVRAVGIGQDALERIYGVAIVDIYAPKGEGRTAAVVAAVQVMNRYKRGDAIAWASGTILVSRSYRNMAIEEENWYHIPVIIEFRADLAH